jgi:hypothetical protein
MKALMTLAALTLTLATTQSHAEYQHEISVNGGKMKVRWSVEGQNLNMEMEAKTKGWVGVGFNPTKDMKDADFIIGRYRKGKFKIEDHFGTEAYKHEKDTELGGKDTITDKKASEEGGLSKFSFTIPLDSGDSKDQKLDPNGQTIMLFAYAARDSLKKQHGFYTTLKVNLSTGKYE